MKPITIASLLDIRTVSSPALSPDGARTAFVVSEPNGKENRYDSCLHVLDHATGEIRPLTFSGKESSFAWDHAHALLFPAERTEADKPEKHREKTVYYRLDLRGGEARRAFELPLEADGIRPLGGGKYLVAAAVNLSALPEDADETAREDEKDCHVLEEVPLWADGRGFVSRRRSALFLFDAEDGTLRKLTGEFFDVASWDVRDGRLLYSGCEYRDRISPFGEVRLMDLETGAEEVLVEPGRFAVGEILLTERSAVLALTDMKEKGLCQFHDWYRYDFSGRTLRLAAKLPWGIGSSGVLDTARGGKSAAAMGEAVCFVAQRGPNSEILRLTREDTLETLVPFDGCITSLDADAEHIAFVGHAAGGLSELYSFENGVPVRRTRVNEAFLSEHAMAEPEYLPLARPDGATLDGWVLRPVDFDPTQRYPGVLEIHGGPHGAYGTALHHEMQALAAAGYIVFCCNPRGSDGYGANFADIRGRYGTVDYEDLMAFTDCVLAHVPQLDANRLAAAGGSYGGFMCNWIEGHTDRFAAIASQRSISNWISDFGSSEIGLTFDADQIGADPWTDAGRLWDASPIKYADRARTPILFIHSLCDYNCPVDQGVEMFSAMKYFGVPARMVLFEGEGHDLSRTGKPRHRLRRLREILDWFDRHLKA